MKCYRLIFKAENSSVLFSDIIEQTLSEEDLSSIIWDRPIIRHEVAGHVHFLALDRDYLDAMLLGVGTYQKLSK